MQQSQGIRKKEKCLTHPCRKDLLERGWCTNRETVPGECDGAGSARCKPTYNASVKRKLPHVQEEEVFNQVEEITHPWISEAH